MLVLLALNFTDLGVYAIAGVSAAISIARNLLVIAPYVSHLLGKPWWTMHWEMLVSILSVAASAAASLAIAAIAPMTSWGTLAMDIAFSCLVSWVLIFLVTFSHEQRRGYAALMWSKLRRK